MSSSLLFSAAHDDSFHDLLPLYSKDARLSVAYLLAAAAVLLLIILLIGIFLLAFLRARTRKKSTSDDVLTENSHISASESIGYDSIISAIP